MQIEQEPKEFNLPYGIQIGVKALIENPEGLILVVKDANSNNWTLPGGRIKKGETPSETLARELKEELRLEIRKIEKPTSVWFFSPADRLNYHVVLLNHRVQVVDSTDIRLGKECSDFTWISPQEFLHLTLPHESLKYALAQEYNLSLQLFRPAKLVRDKIPDIMRQKGETPRVEELISSEEYFQALLKKLQEESCETAFAQDTQSLIGELVDVLEVIEAILKVKKITSKELEKVRKKKWNEKGGFNKRFSIY